MGYFGVVGGDRRQLYAARSLEKRGWNVLLAGWEQGEGTEGLHQVSLEEVGRQCENVLLPLPVTRDGLMLHAPFSQAPIPLGDGFARLLSRCRVFVGMAEKLQATSSLWQQIPLLDYAAREEMALGNAFLTAEGAIALAVEKIPGGLWGSRCLVTGFGRIGKALCLDLRGMGAQVACCARKPWDLTAIRALGCKALTYEEMDGPYSVIFNTVPAPVLGERALSRQSEDTVLLELASAPGGIDREAARRWNVPVIDAPSLPGKYSPKASGELIVEAVYPMLHEERRNLQ